MSCHAAGVTATPCTGTPACWAWTWGRRRARCSGCRWWWLVTWWWGDVVTMLYADRTDAHQQTGLQLQPRGRGGHLQRAQQHPHIINNYNYNYHNYNCNYYYHNHNENDNFYSAGLCWCLRKQDFIVGEVGGASDENIPHLFFGPCLPDNGVKNMYFWVHFWRVYIFYITKLWIMNDKQLSKYKISATASEDCNTGACVSILCCHHDLIQEQICRVSRQQHVPLLISQLSLLYFQCQHPPHIVRMYPSIHGTPKYRMPLKRKIHSEPSVVWCQQECPLKKLSVKH